MCDFRVPCWLAHRCINPQDRIIAHLLVIHLLCVLYGFCNCAPVYHYYSTGIYFWSRAAGTMTNHPFPRPISNQTTRRKGDSENGEQQIPRDNGRNNRHAKKTTG